MSKFDNKLNKINRCLELPEGLLSGGVHIELQSDSYAVIDGKCSVLQYSDSEIRMNTGSGIVVFKGRRLELDTLGKTSATISGQIGSLTFSK